MTTRVFTRRTCAIATVGLLTAPSHAGAVHIDRMVGAASTGECFLVRRFAVSAPCTVVGAELVTNDLHTTFPRILFLDGNGEGLSALHVLATAEHVTAEDKHVLEVTWAPLAIDAGKTVYVAVALPPSAGVQAFGVGPGMGAVNTAGVSSSYVASADDGIFQPLDVDLCVRLLTPGTGKAGATLTRNLPHTASLTAHPNPFTPLTGIDGIIPVRAFVDAAIYAVSGRRVRSLASGVLSPGRYRWEWDGRDEQGRSVSGGVYLARLRAGETVLTHRLILIR